MTCNVSTEAISTAYREYLASRRYRSANSVPMAYQFIEAISLLLTFRPEQVSDGNETVRFSIPGIIAEQAAADAWLKMQIARGERRFGYFNTGCIQE